MRTRDLFWKDFRKNGVTPFNHYLKLYKVGDDVDIKVDGVIHKGMFHKFYHGRTDVVFNQRDQEFYDQSKNKY